jgi:biopolymer transport protein ExbD
MGMAVGGNKGSMSEPNIVPLIDVLLVLIIIFMVITPTTPQGLDTLVPQPSPPNQPENKELLAKTIVVQAWTISSSCVQKKWLSLKVTTLLTSAKSRVRLTLCAERGSIA